MNFFEATKNGYIFYIEQYLKHENDINIYYCSNYCFGSNFPWTCNGLYFAIIHKKN